MKRIGRTVSRFGAAIPAALGLAAVAACHSHGEIDKPTHEIVTQGRTSGCWVDVWEDEDYDGTQRRIRGPATLSTLDLEDENWKNDIQSVRVGPNAWVRVYKDSALSGSSIWLVPNQRIADLDSFDLGNEIESMEIFDREPAELRTIPPGLTTTAH